MKAIAMTQPIRNQLSLLAWMVAAFCAWLLFLAAAASASTHTHANAEYATTSAKAPE